MSRPQRISYVLMAAMLLLVGFFHMATLLLSTLFCFLSLQILSFGRSKFLGLILFYLLFAGAACGLVYFAEQAYVAFPEIADKTIPAVAKFAARQGVELPFKDLDGLKEVVMDKATERAANVGVLARNGVLKVIYLIIGFIVATSLFFDGRFRLEGDPHTAGDNLYTLTGQQLSLRFQNFFHSFAIVMGAQLAISAVNTVLTGIFVSAAGFVHVPVLVIFTFLCGLLPIVGNVVSNIVITGVAFTISPDMALVALMFLILIHKLEYFLNSKIVGSRIKNPMWLTLLALLLGEKLMGVAGMILAPVVLHYIKVESSQAKTQEDAQAAAGGHVTPRA